MSDAPRVGIVLLNYNGRDQLENCLPSILALEYDPYEVLVVDNASTDGSAEFVRERYPEVDVLENDVNVGFSRGNNLGAAALPDVDYLWFLNTDVEVEPTALTHLVEHVESTPGTKIVAPRLNYLDDRSTIQSAGFDLDVSGVPHPRDNGDAEPSSQEPYPVTYGTGAALLVERDAWDELGGFDDGNFIYGDDTYLCFLAWMRGYRVEVVPQSVVYHEMGASREKMSTTVAYHWGRSRVRWYLKLMEPRSILSGAPGFLLLVLKFLVADVVLRRSPKAAVYRVAGLLSPLLEPRRLYDERRRIQRQRVRDDEEFIRGA